MPLPGIVEVVAMAQTESLTTANRGAEQRLPYPTITLRLNHAQANIQEKARRKRIDRTRLDKWEMQTLVVEGLLRPISRYGSQQNHKTDDSVLHSCAILRLQTATRSHFYPFRYRCSS